jgi:hypothetical protein
MSHNKTCQIDKFIEPSKIKHLEVYGDLEGLPIEIIPCANRAKHSVVVRALELSSRRTAKFRLCDFHFKFVQESEEEHGIADFEGSEAPPIFKFRRNRL